MYTQGTYGTCALDGENACPTPLASSCCELAIRLLDSPHHVDAPYEEALALY